MSIRVGIGYDSHRFEDRDEGGGADGSLAGSRSLRSAKDPSTPPPYRHLILGGVIISDHPGLVGHSDGDAVAHALTDAVLGAAAMGNIGSLFPNNDPINKNRNSIEMLRLVIEHINAKGYKVQQVDVTVITESPKIAPHAAEMAKALAAALGVSADDVSIKGKTNEGMGWIGRGEGLACMAVATLTS